MCATAAARVSPMSRRRRCTGPCGDLFQPERLAKVGGRDELCPDCLLLEANAIAPVQDAEPVMPEPLPLRDEDERFEGMLEYAVEGWPLKRGRLSASALGTYMRCPEQFRREKILGEKRPDNGTGLIGTGAHGAIEAALRLKLETGELASPKQIADTFDAVYEAAVFKAESRQGIAWGKAEKKDLDFDRGRRIGRDTVEAYAASDAFRHLEPVALEHVFAFTVPGVPVPFCGLIDVVEPHATIDLKFGDQCVSAVRPEWRLAALIYGFATRTPPAFHSISWAGKVQGPREAAGLRVEWTPMQAVLAARLMRSVVWAILADAERLGRDQPWAGTGLGHTWACSSCAFKPDCAWWNVSDEELFL